MQHISNAENIRAISAAPVELVEQFGDEGDNTRKYLLNPALFVLLGDVHGKTMLDAGCGQGYLCRLLARRGARITGIEPAQLWYAYAWQREQQEALGIQYVQDDLSTWTPEPERYDWVIANMVFMDIPDYLPALHNCVAALKPGGGLIFSLLHPCFEESGSAWAGKGYVEIRDYFCERPVAQSYGYYIHRPLSAYLNSVIQAGCAIRQVIEPQMDEETAARLQAERYACVPGYIVIYAVKG
jgi:2-polyprenyl-3-methyl-5-hydroxy-6-metoxy-1,4-benzoquinol methylase